MSNSWVYYTLPSATVGQAYSASVEVSSNGQFSPNFIVNFLPNGISVSNASAGWSNSIYEDGTKDSNGYYHVDLAGTPTQAGNSAVTVEVSNTFHSLDVSKTYSLTVNPAPANTNPGTNDNVTNGQAHPTNTNIVGLDGTVYLIQNGFRSPYTSAGAFLSYRFNSWANVVPATSGDLVLPITPYGGSATVIYFIPPRNGSLINDKGTIYLMTQGQRAGFVSSKVFLALGYSFSNAQPGDASFMGTLAPISNSSIVHPDGTLVRYNGTIYIMKNGTRMGFPSMQVFTS